MDRREFITKAILGGLAGVGAVGWLDERVTAADPGGTELIVANGGEPGDLLRAALLAYGGLRRLIRPGSTMVIKANFSAVGPPEWACNTNPDLLAALVGACRTVGARRVRVVDIAVHPPQMCLERSGIRKAVLKAGGEVEDLRFAPHTNRSCGVLSKDFSVCTEALTADCLLNVPILKQSAEVNMSGALKSLMGLTGDRTRMHTYGIDQAIVDLARLIKPHLHIVDAYRVLKTNGPFGPGEVARPRQLILSRDPVAADAYGARILNLEPTYLRQAVQAGLGCADLSRVKIKKVVA